LGEEMIYGPSRLDRPEIQCRLFHPRPDHGPCPPGVRALHLRVAPGIELGARFHARGLAAPTLLFFHGNGEIAADYDDLGPLFARAGVNFLVVDYRGYGRSDGVPAAGALLPDAHAAWASAREWLAEEGYRGPVMVGGRSLGSAPAVELAATLGAGEVGGLLVESGFARTLPLLRTLGIDPSALGLTENDGFGNLDKIRRYRGSTVVIHGGRDDLIPPQEGRDLFAASGSEDKRLVLVDRADHNSVFVHGLGEYLEAVAALSGSAAIGR